MPPNNPPAKVQDTAAFIQGMATALGLGPDATAEDVLDALAQKLAGAREATPDPRKFVPVEAVAELLSDRNLRVSAMQEAQATALVEKAFAEGYLTPAMRDWATALCSQDPDSFKQFINHAPRPYAHMFTSMTPPRSAIAEHGNDSDEAAAMCAQLGLKPGALNG